MTSFAYVHTLGGVLARKVREAPARAGVDRPGPANEDEDVTVSDRWFFDSSFELKHGLVVREVAVDALPTDVFERLFRR